MASAAAAAAAADPAAAAAAWLGLVSALQEEAAQHGARALAAVDAVCARGLAALVPHQLMQLGKARVRPHLAHLWATLCEAAAAADADDPPNAAHALLCDALQARVVRFGRGAHAQRAGQDPAHTHACSLQAYHAAVQALSQLLAMLAQRVMLSATHLGAPERAALAAVEPQFRTEAAAALVTKPPVPLPGERRVRDAQGRWSGRAAVKKVVYLRPPPAATPPPPARAASRAPVLVLRSQAGRADGRHGATGRNGR